MRTSESVAALMPALEKAQYEFPVIERTKDGQVGPRRYKYADLGDVLAATKEILHTNNLLLIQLPEITEAGKQVLTTRIVHTPSSEWVEGELDLGGVIDSQRLGSAITYARRYCASAALKLATEEDDDGRKGSGVPVGSTDDTGLRPIVNTLKAEILKVSGEPKVRRQFVLDTLKLYDADITTYEEMSDDQITTLLKAIDQLGEQGA
jgi:hypothetical protein